jgi:hypothetical protein
MKKISLFAFTTFLAILFIISCDKKLDLLRPDQPTTTGYWTNETQAINGTTAMYSALTVDGTYMRSYPGLNDSRGDDFIGDSPWADLVLTGQFIIPSTSGPVEWIWRDHYQIVNRANQVLEGVGGMDATQINADLKKRVLGQAYFLRGLAYYNLATTFKIIPILTSSKLTVNDLPATATEEVIWNQIFSDFRAAEANLPISYDNVTGLDKGQKGRATMGSAAGMLGKAYLYRKDWTKAAAQFQKFFTGGPLQGVYSLMPEYRDNFKDVNENNRESLFEVQFTAGGSSDNWCCEPNAQWRQWTSVSITYGMDGKGFSDYLPTRWIYNEFKQEKTVGGGNDPRLLATIASYELPSDTAAYNGPWTNPKDRIYPRKYTNDGLGPTNEAFGGSFINYRILRYADILLMHAEALNELNRTTEAYPFIQMVRSRANLPNLATVRPNMTQAQMRDQIAHERALEFSIEGQRIHDIIRWGWLYNPTKLAELKAHDADFNSWTPGNEYLPIPQRELELDKNLLPNPAN